MSTHISLAKASHIAKSKVKSQGSTLPLMRGTIKSLVKNIDTGRGENLGSKVQSPIQAIFIQ